MNPWKTLNIEPTDDKKTIKKAYAILIKQYKPDEYPEKFQEIQIAYKTALSMRQWQQFDAENETPTSQQETLIQDSHQTEEPPLPKQAPQQDEKIYSEQQKQETLIQDSHQTEEPPLPKQTPQQDEKIYSEQQKQEALIQNLYQQLHQIVFASLADKSQLEKWKFIEDYYNITDLSLKTQVATEFFKKVAEYNLFQKKQNNTFLISPSIMRYLNEVFDWSINWNQLQNQFPEYYFTVTLDLFDNKFKAPNWFDSVSLLLYRGLAFIIDVFIYLVVAFLISQLLLPDYKKATSIMILGFVFYYLLSELFLKKHLSVGKKYIGLLVLDKFGNNSDKNRVLGRHLAFHLINLLPFYLFLLDIIPSEKVFINLTLLIFTANAVVFWQFKQLIHDLLTNSHVIKTNLA